MVDQERERQTENDRTATAAFKVRVALPGSLGEEITARVQSLRVLPEAQDLAEPNLGEALALPGGPGWPEPEVRVTLRRLGDTGSSANGRLATSYNLYESDETVLLLADPRASSGYTRQELTDGDWAGWADEASQCRRCTWPAYLPNPEAEEPDQEALGRVKELVRAAPTSASSCTRTTARPPPLWTPSATRTPRRWVLPRLSAGLTACPHRCSSRWPSRPSTRRPGRLVRPGSPYRWSRARAC